MLISDFNECENDNGGCEDDCSNIEGSYLCNCEDGYNLDSNAYNCNGW